MDSSVVQRHIKELEKVRARTRAMRLAFMLATLGIVVVCVGLIYNSVRGLTQPGPAQDEFSNQLSASLQRDVVPRVQTIASETLTELRPEVEASFSKLNARAPELSSTAMQEFQTLNQNVSKRGEETLERTLGAMLAKKEEKVRAMFPGTSDAQIKAMLTSVSNEAQARILNTHDQLLSPHMNQLQGIVGHLSVIQAQERVNPTAPHTDTELVSTVVDLLHSDLHATSDAHGQVKPQAVKSVKSPVKTQAKGAAHATAQRGY